MLWLAVYDSNMSIACRGLLGQDWGEHVVAVRVSVVSARSLCTTSSISSLKTLTQILTPLLTHSHKYSLTHTHIHLQKYSFIKTFKQYSYKNLTSSNSYNCSYNYSHKSTHTFSLIQLQLYATKYSNIHQNIH